MKQYTNPYTQKIFALLVPLVGEIMAQGIVKSQAGKIGRDEDSINSGDLPGLAEFIRKGLVLFVGSDVAKQISDKIMDLK